MTPTEFITKWQNSGAGERANCQPFVLDLCTLLEVATPDPKQANESKNAYVFERAITINHGDGTTTTNYIDCYKRGTFILEAKQGSDAPAAQATLLEPTAKPKRGTARRGTTMWDKAMVKARAQAEGYVRALPTSEGRPPFIVVVDVGYSIEVYSEFSCSGGTYVPFPDPTNHRIMLTDLEHPAIRERLATLWNEPLSLDPSRISAEATRDIAEKLAVLARSLETTYSPEAVASFLMRLIFTMFAEDMKLLPRESFRNYLRGLRGHANRFKAFIEPVWQVMNTGGFSRDLRETLLHFNGGLFADSSALDLSEEQLEFLIVACERNWSQVEPAIFGTLLERALDPTERHNLGAHYTPRAYVERVVQQTVLEPLREDWAIVQVEFAKDLELGKIDAALKKIEAFHYRLCQIKILDPACGSGNFLYVALEMLKRLEGEVLDVLEAIGGNRRFEMEQNTVDPHQFLGIEVNPRAAKLAELVLWIGYLQWHFRTSGDARPPIPVLKAFRNIVCGDAVLAYDDVRPVVDASGHPVTRWDGVTVKKHPVTGQDVPDESAQVQKLEYINPRQTVWAEADFVIGNPPFIGAAPMRESLGDGYVETLRRVYPDVPESSDFVMYWWHRAAALLKAGKLLRFGLVSTNSVKQTFNRRVMSGYLEGNALHLCYAIPDHPWVDAANGAAVRIAITVAARGAGTGKLERVVSEQVAAHGEYEVELESQDGLILADLTIGANVVGARGLRANRGLSSRGMMLGGKGFIVTREQALSLGFGRKKELGNYIREYKNGRDLTTKDRDVLAIDLFGLTESEIRSKFPEVYQWLYERVRPERQQNNDPKLRDFWWLHRRSLEGLRNALDGLQRYIVTVETMKHRLFSFLDSSILPDNKLVVIALEDAYHLGVLSSRVHVVWALAAGGNLGVGNDPVYVKTDCFDKFPFPNAIPAQIEAIRQLGEQLDAHRKRQQAQHGDLTLTQMYNVLEKLRSGEALSEVERRINEQGLVSLLLELHQALDAAVFAAYGWDVSLSDGEILERLVALNSERSEEERNGVVRYLRPEFQNPAQVRQTAMLEAEDEVLDVEVGEKLAYPKGLGAQSLAIRTALRNAKKPLSSVEVSGLFKGAKKAQVAELLEFLASLGQIRGLDGGRYWG